MSFTFLGPDPLETQIAAVLHKLEAGLRPSEIEVAQVDIKEEPGRRGPGGVVEPGDLESEEAAQYLAEEMVCMANTAGGGAIIVGIADNGDRIGTELRAEWLRHRIFELSSNRLTLTIREGDLDGTRLLILTTPEAIEPIRFRNKIKWRVDDNCVEVDATSWYAGRIQRTVDWSSHRSGHTLDDVNPLALEHARRSLRGTSESDDLAESPDNDLVRRLNLTDGEGYLTNAGSLLLVETPGDGIDYIRRNAHGSDSTGRYQGHGAPLLEQLAEVDRASDSANRVVHLAEGFAHNQLRSIPPRPMREAIVNGVVHRDWHSATPTTVEHVGDTITVTSPGGFIGGVSPSNIITHPAVPRYRSLAEALAALNLAEREGIGIDRMVQDMLAQGHQPPHIEETPGPYVRVALVGGEPDSNTVEFLNAIEPTTAAALDSLLILELVSIVDRWRTGGTSSPTIHD